MDRIGKGIAQIAVAAALAVGLSIGSANAAPGDCGDELGLVETAIYAAEFLGNRADVDRDGLLKKVQMARVKVGLDQFENAILKLENAEERVQQMQEGTKPKIGDGAQDILDALRVAIACVWNL